MTTATEAKRLNKPGRYPCKHCDMVGATPNELGRHVLWAHRYKRASEGSPAVNGNGHHEVTDDTFLEDLGEAVMTAMVRLVGKVNGLEGVIKQERAERAEAIEAMKRDFIAERKQWAEANRRLTEERDRLANELNTKRVKNKRFTLNDLKQIVEKANS